MPDLLAEFDQSLVNDNVVAQDPTLQEFDQMIERKNPVTKYATPKTWFGEAKAGLSRGIDELQQMGYGLGALATTGDLHKKFIDAVDQQDREIQASPASVPTYESVDSFDTFMRYFSSGIGEIAPQIGQSVASGVAGAVIGTAAEPGAGTAIGAIGGLIERKAITNLVKSQIDDAAKAELRNLAAGTIEKKALSETAKSLLVNETKNLGGKYGAMGAVAANSWGQESASIYTDLQADPNIPESDKRLSSILGGFTAAILDAGFEGWVVSKFFKGATRVAKEQVQDASNYFVRFAKTYGKELMKVAPAESAQEYSQTIIEEAAKNYADPAKRDAIFDFTPEQKTSFVDAMFKGAIGGVLGGGVAAIAETKSTKQLTPSPDPVVRQAERDIQGQADDILPKVTKEDVRITEINKRQEEISQELTRPDITPEETDVLNKENTDLEKEYNDLAGIETPQDILVNDIDTIKSRIKSSDLDEGTKNGLLDIVNTSKSSVESINHFISALDTKEKFDAAYKFTFDGYAGKVGSSESENAQEVLSSLIKVNKKDLKREGSGGSAIAFTNKKTNKLIKAYNVGHYAGQIVQGATITDLEKKISDINPDLIVSSKPIEGAIAFEQQKVVEANKVKDATENDKKLFEEARKQNPILSHQLVETDISGKGSGLVVIGDKVFSKVFDFDGLSEEEIQKHKQEIQESKMTGINLSEFSKSVQEQLLETSDKLEESNKKLERGGSFDKGKNKVFFAQNRPLQEGDVTPKQLIAKKTEIQSIVNETPTTTPNPEKGMVRFYHGGVKGTGGRFVTPDLEYAKGYAAKSGGSVQYVDLPENDTSLKKSYDDTGLHTPAPYISFETTDEQAKGFKDYSEYKQEPARTTVVEQPKKDTNLPSTEGDTIEGAITSLNRFYGDKTGTRDVSIQQEPRVTPKQLIAKKTEIQSIVNEIAGESANKESGQAYADSALKVIGTDEFAILASENDIKIKRGNEFSVNQDQTKKGNIILTLAPVRYLSGYANILARKGGSNASNSSRINQVKSLDSILAHEVAHIADNIALKKEWNKTDKSIDLNLYANREFIARGKALRLAARQNPKLFKGIGSLAKRVYEYAAEGSLKDEQLGQEIPRMMVELARTGRIDEVTQAITQARAEANDSKKGVMSDFLKSWIKAIRGIRDVLHNLISSDKAPQELKTAYENINKVLDKYGVLVNETDKQTQKELQNAKKANEGLKSETLDTAIEREKQTKSLKVSASTNKKTERVKGKSKDVRDEASRPARAAEPSRSKTTKSKNGNQNVISLELDGKVVSSLGYYINEDSAEIDFVKTEKEFQRQGFATTLYKELKKELEKRGIKYVTGEIQSQKALDIRQSVFGPADYFDDGVKTITEEQAREYLPPNPELENLDRASARKIFVKNEINKESDSKRIISTALYDPSQPELGFVKGLKWNSPHASITLDAILAGLDDTKMQYGFIVNEDGKEVFKTRAEAEPIAVASGQVKEGFKSGQAGMQSQDLIDENGDTNETASKSAEPKYTKSNANNINKAAKNAGGVSATITGNFTPKETEQKNRAGKVDYEWFTQRDLTYSTQTNTQSAIQADKIVRDSGGVVETAEKLLRDPQGKDLNIVEDSIDGIVNGPDGVLTALYENVIRQLENVFDQLEGTEASFRTKFYIKDLIEKMDEQNRAGLTKAGQRIQGTAKSEKLWNADTAEKEHNDVVFGGAEKIIGDNAKIKMKGLASAFNNLRAEHAGEMVNDPKVIAVIRDLQRKFDQTKFGQGYRKLVADSVKKIKAIVQNAASKAAEVISDQHDGIISADIAIKSIVGEMTGIPKMDGTPSEHSVVIAALNATTREIGKEMGLISDDPKIKRLTPTEKMAAILKSEHLINYYADSFEDQYNKVYGGNNPSEMFLQQTKDIADSIRSQIWTKDLPKKIVNEKLKEINTKFSDIVKQSYDEGGDILKKIQDGIAKYMKEQGVDNNTLMEQLAQQIEDQFQSNLEEARSKFFTSSKTVREFIKNAQESMADLIRAGAKYTDLMEGKFKDQLMEEFSIPELEARQLANAMQGKLNELTKDAKQKLADKWVESVMKSKMGKALEKFNPKNEQKLSGSALKVLELSNLGLLNTSDVYEAMQERFPFLPKYDPKVVEQIRAYGEQIDKSETDYQKNQLIQAISDLIATKKGFETTSSYLSWMYFSMLSGVGTAFVNIGGDVTKLMDYTIVESIKHPQRIPQILRTLVTSAIGGAQLEARQAFWTGYTDDKRGEKFFMSKNVVELPDAFFTSDKLREKFGDKIADADIKTATFIHKVMVGAKLKYFGRSLQATDIFFRKIAEEMAYTARQGEQITTPEMWDSARVKAQNEMLAIGKNPFALENKREFQILANSILKDARLRDADGNLVNEKVSAWTESLSEGMDATFTGPPKYWLGKISDMVEKLTEGNVIGKMIVPFTRISAAVTNTMLEWTPFGFIRWGLVQEGNPIDRIKNWKLTKEDDIAIRAVLGTAAIFSLLALMAGQKDDDDPVFWIYGPGPRDLEKKRQLMEKGWRPYTFKAGKGYVSYIFTPWAMAFGLVGKQMDDYKDGKIRDPNDISIASSAVAMVGAVTNQSFLASIADLLGAIDSPDPEGKLGKVAARWAAIPVPNLFKQIDRYLDPSIQEAKGFKETFIKEYPIARWLLNPALNRFGKPIKRTTTGFPGFERFLTFERTDDEVLNLISDKGVRLPGISRNTRIGNVAITQEQYYKYVQLQGPRFEDRIRSELGSLRMMTKEEIEERIIKIDQEEKKKARNILTNSR